jgi:hypothetical protein
MKKQRSQLEWYKTHAAKEQLDHRRRTWSAQQWGWYHLLRNYAWCQEPQGKMPANEKLLREVAKKGPKDSDAQFRQVVGFFKQIGKWLIDPDAHPDLVKFRKLSKAQSAKAKKRWAKSEAPTAEETLLWRGISWPEWALKKLRLEVGCESDALKVEIDSLPDLRQTNPKKAAKIEAEKALYLADLKIMDLCAKTIDDVLAHPAEHRGQGKVKVTWGGKEWYPSELVEKITQNRLLSAAQSVGRKDTNIVRVKSSLANLEIRSIYVALQVVEDQSELNLRPDKQPSASRSVAVGVPGKSKKTRELPPDIQEQIDAAKRSLAA